MDRRHFRTPDQLSGSVQGHRNERVTLDTYTCDLNLNVDQSGYVGTPQTRGGFAYIWAGARATHGFKRGQVCFSVKILENLDVPHLPEDERNPHVVRVGFSCYCTSLNLGEEPLSCGYGGTGKKCMNGEYFQYGKRFSKGDIITAFLDYQPSFARVSFAVNGYFQGEAHRIPKSDLIGRGLFPHIITRNCRFKVNFGQLETYLPQGYEHFLFPDEIPIGELEKGYTSPRRTEDCEFLMMVGLPASGKTTWIEEECRKHHEKSYNVLGTDKIMSNMKVFGLNENYNTRFQALYKHAENCLDQLLDIASRRKRNYILDQTNVYASARERKISDFTNFRRIAVVVVPSDEVYMKRLFSQQKSGKIIPENAILRMKANFSIPEEGQHFDDVIFAGMQLRNVTSLVSSYNMQGRKETGMQVPEKKKSRVTTNLEHVTSRMTVNLDVTYPSPNDGSGAQKNYNGQGRRDHYRDGGSRRNMEERNGASSQGNRSSHDGKYYREPNDRARGPNRAISTSALNTVTANVEHVTSKMTVLNLDVNYPSPPQRNYNSRGRRDPSRDGGPRRNIEERVDSSSQRNRTSHQGRNYRGQNNRGRGPNRAVSTSALNTGQYYSWEMQGSNF